MKLKGRVGGSPQQRRGPLRRIVEVLTFSEGIFDRPTVLLECGHKVASTGAYKARCNKCLLDLKQPAPAPSTKRTGII